MKNSFNAPVFPLLTQQKKVPFFWILTVNLSWFIGLYTMFVISNVLPLTLRRFTDDTRLMSLVASIGLWFGIVLGPLVNYISDRIWTRFGRRRPFLMIACCGSLLANFCVPFMPALTPLILLVVVSSILGDVGSTQEPLWLEVIPPNQRGQGFAVRILLINMASLLFYQIMFAQIKHVYHLPGGWTLNGEQTCYLSAALLQSGYLMLLLFGLREVRPDGVRLQSPREIRSEQLIRFIRSVFAKPCGWHWLLLAPLPLPVMLKLSLRPGLNWMALLIFPAAFTVRFVRDVFTEHRWWWIYLFYVTPTLIAPVGTFMTLMYLEQFKYSPLNVALTGWPVMVMSNLVVTPFMGWYADRLKHFPALLLGAIVTGCAAAVYYFAGFWHDIPKPAALLPYWPQLKIIARLDLPPMWGLMIIGFFGITGSGTFTILCFQALRRLSPNANPRIWAWLLGHIKTLGMCFLTYLCIKVFAEGQVPGMTVWFLLMCLTHGISCLQIVAGPLLYDFIPKDKIGTLSSGFGLLNTAITAFITTFAGWWVRYFSLWSSGGATDKDYTSVYTMQMFFGVFAVVLIALLAFRVATGRMAEYGRLGLNSTDPVPPRNVPPPEENSP